MPESCEISPIEASIELFRYLSPTKTEENLKRLAQACPELESSLKEIIDVPSRVLIASQSNNREFLTIEMFSRNGCYRCPWDGLFYGLDGQVSEEIKFENILREFEVTLNEAVASYGTLYYGSDVLTSAFVEAGEADGSMTVAVLIKKRIEANEEDSASAVWDSLHVYEIENVEADTLYRQTSTVMLSFENSAEGIIELSGNLVKQSEATIPSGSSQLVQIGKMLEEAEGRLRSDLQSVYFGRTHDTVNELRKAVPGGYLRNQNDLREEMLSKIGARN